MAGGKRAHQAVVTWRHQMTIISASSSGVFTLLAAAKKISAAKNEMKSGNRENQKKMMK